MVSFVLACASIQRAMGIREDIQRRIDRKQQELVERDAAHTVERAAALSYIQALQDTLKTLPRDISEARSAEQVLRPGSGVAQARDVLRRAGKPMHITEILRAMGRDLDKESRLSLGGSISNYVRRGEIFVRTAPNTFGLSGMKSDSPDEPPPDFGAVRTRPAHLSIFSGEADEPVQKQPEPEPELDDDEVPF